MDHSMLSEHEAAEKDTKQEYGKFEQGEHEKAIKKMVMKLLWKAKKHKAKFDKEWLDDYKMFRGKQWMQQRPSYRHSGVLNVIFQAIQSQVPLLTDSRPKIEFLPQEPGDLQIAEILNDLITHDWDRGNWLRQLVECLYDSHFFGGAVGSMEVEDIDTVPEIVFESVDPLKVFPDPCMKKINDRRGRYIIVIDVKDVEALKRKYPQFKEYIKADMQELAQGDKFDFSKERVTPPIDQDTGIIGDETPEAYTKDMALEITCYLKSDEKEEFEQEETASEADEFGVISKVTKKIKGTKKKYPNGRKIVIAGGAVVVDDHNHYDDGKFPYAKMVNYPDPHEFWGISEIEQMREPQKIYNKVYSFILDTMTLMGNPQWVIDTNSQVDPDFIFNRPGEIIMKAPGSEVRRESGVPLPGYVQNLLQTVRAELDNLSGSQDVSRGAKPQGGLPTSGIAIESLQEASQTRIRQKSREIDAFLQELGQLYLSRVFQFYTIPRVFRLTANDNTQRYFKFHTETDEMGQKKAFVRPFIPTEDGGMAMGDQKEYIVQGEMDVKVSTGSSLAFLKDRKRREILELLQLGIVDQEYVIKQLDIPGGEALIEKIQQQAQMAEQQAMAEQGPPQGPPAGPPQ